MAVGVAAVVIGLGLLSPWLSARATRDAASSWPTDLVGAFDDLDTASDLNPISPQPELVRASIAQRVGVKDAARRGFVEALDRDPRNTYAVLELGAMAAEAGQRAEATAWLNRLHTLDPRSETLGHNRARKNWNSVGDHAPAYLINVVVALARPDLEEFLVNTGDSPEEVSIELKYGYPATDSTGTVFIRLIDAGTIDTPRPAATRLSVDGSRGASCFTFGLKPAALHAAKIPS